MTWRQDVSKVLDLPCGHGRVSRHLKLLFPTAEMFYCDIDAEGADFCARTFGGTAIHSQPDLLQVGLPRSLDVIWIGSLFTHVDRKRTADWLGYLADHLSEQWRVAVKTVDNPRHRRQSAWPASRLHRARLGQQPRCPRPLQERQTGELLGRSRLSADWITIASVDEPAALLRMSRVAYPAAQRSRSDWPRLFEATTD
ncbi:methyltransferase domain-containing protein [Aminobacter ciceronei]|uniref:Trans-aconitate methyltransferase n=1 Tax=Aminobacter ciceronei TaxID=150723 RepID=A0ABR6C2J1_9HYPH|nr:trans-aconitate methyltransferase [Aminobacter ciceronei]